MTAPLSRAGVEVGGTFTDLVYVRDGEIVVAKALGPLGTDDNRLAELDQDLAAKPVPVDVVQAAGNDADIGLAARRNGERDTCRAGLELDQLRFNVTDAFREDADAVARFEHLVDAFERIAIVCVFAIFFATIDGHRTTGIQ